MATTLATRVLPPTAFGSRRAVRMIERNAMVYRRTWLILVSGFFEPLFYLLSIGVGISKLLTQDLHAPSGAPITYTAYIAPALLASSAMNGAMFDATFNMFFKLKYAKTYDAILATPVSVGDIALGEIGWALFRGALYGVAFLIVMAAMGLVHSWWALAALPAATLIGFAFAAIGMAGTSYMRSWQDFQYVTLGDTAVVPVLGDVLPAVALPVLVADRRRGHAALPRRRAVAGARPRRCRSRRDRPRGVPARGSAWSARWSPPAGWASCC